MGILHRFDLSTDLTQFFLVGVIIMMTFTVLLTVVAPKGGRKRRGKGKIDDRVVNWDGELID